MRSPNIYDKFRSEPVYLMIPGEDFAVRSEPGSGYFVKFSGKPEYASEYKNPIVMEAIDGGEEISKSEYENF